jgi:hypothetical protein
MQMSLILTAFFFSISARAFDSIGPTPSARALGMGNAFTAIVDNIDSLYYNPAGLAKVHGIQLDLLTADGAGKNLTDYNTLKSLGQSTTNLATALPPLYGQNFYYGGNARTGIAVPMFGAALYNAVNASAVVHNPPYTQIDVDATNDYTYALGFGVPIGPYVQLGAEGRYIKRSGTSYTYSGSDFVTLSNNQIASDILAWGRGYELDVGANFIIPIPQATFDFSLVWQNVGTTTFIQDASNHVPSIPENVIAGMGADIRLPLVTIRPAFDYRYITDNDIQLFRKFNFGVEISLPLIDIRGGFSEGYYTYGAGVSFGPVRVDAASYAAELGDYPGQIEDRRYMAEVTIELDLGHFGVDDSREDPKAKGSGSGSSGSSGSRSIWGGSTRLKERR